jgi:hypothetical protein
MDGLWGVNGGTVNVNSPLSVTGDFQQGSGNFWGDGPVTVGGSNSQWTGGDIKMGAGGFLNTGTLNINAFPSGEAPEFIDGTLTNQGTINLAGQQTLYLFYNATLNNTSGATFDFLDDSTIDQLFGGTLTNAGTVEKTGGTGTSDISTTFNNNGGTLYAASGTLAVNSAGGLVNGGTLEADSGATLSLMGGSGTVDYAGTFTGSGAGTVALSGGTLAVTSAGAAFNLPGSMFQWTGGTIDVSSGGTLTNSSTGVFNLNAHNIEVNGAGTLANQGTINAAGVSNLILSHGSTFSNALGATFDFTGDSSVSNSGTLLNAGLLEKTGGTGTSIISSAFDNNGGAITVQTGAVSLKSAGGLVNSGTFSVAAGATLNLADSVTVDYAGTFTGSGAGSVVLNSYSTLQVASGGATFNLPGSLLQLTGGTIDVSNGNLTNAGTITIAGNADVALTGAGSLINNKSINETSTAYLYVENGATLNNSAKGTYNLAGDGGIAASGTVALLNAGTLKKSAGTGTSYVDVPLNNTGSVQVLSGTLDLRGAVTQTANNTLTAGSWTVSHSATSNSTLDIVSAGNLTAIGAKAKVTINGLNTTFTNLAGLASNAGRFSVLGGQTFSTPGDFTNTGKLTLGAGSILAVGGSFTQTSAGTLTVQLGGTASKPKVGTITTTASGTVSLGGTLNVTGTGKPAVGSKLTLVNNEGSGTASGLFAGLPEGATFTVNGMTFRISYQGGDGNDVVLTRTA